jgi:hypothetical protein
MYKLVNGFKVFKIESDTLDNLKRKDKPIFIQEEVEDLLDLPRNCILVLNVQYYEYFDSELAKDLNIRGIELYRVKEETYGIWLNWTNPNSPTLKHFYEIKQFWKI